MLMVLLLTEVHKIRQPSLPHQQKVHLLNNACFDERLLLMRNWLESLVASTRETQPIHLMLAMNRWTGCWKL